MGYSLRNKTVKLNWKCENFDVTPKLYTSLVNYDAR